MSKPTLALVAHAIHFRGGQERNFAELAARLCRDYDVHLVASEVNNVPLEQLTIHYIPTMPRPHAVRFSSFYRKATRFLSRNSFDIVHTIGGIVRRQDVITAQFCQAAWLAHVRSEPTIPGFTLYHFWTTKLAERVEKQAARDPGTRAVLANSHKTERDWISHYGVDRTKMHVIYNGVDSHRFAPAAPMDRSAQRSRLGYAETDFVALFVGEYLRKNLADVLRALPLLPAQVKLLAVGRGDLAIYRRLAQELRVENRVIFHEPVSHVETMFSAVDAFVFPTLYEPFGMVITEAMASGLPVVTTHSAGASELIKDGINGFLLQSAHDYRTLADRLQQMLDHPADRQALAQAARAGVRHVTWDDIADKTAAVYKKLLTEKH